MCEGLFFIASKNCLSDASHMDWNEPIFSEQKPRRMDFRMNASSLSL